MTVANLRKNLDKIAKILHFSQPLRAYLGIAHSVALEAQTMGISRKKLAPAGRFVCFLFKASYKLVLSMTMNNIATNF